MFGNVGVVLGPLLENLQKSSESGRKSSENRQKRRYYNTRLLVNVKFLFSCSTLSHLLAALTREISR